MGSNMTRLGETLANRMKQSARAAVPVSMELGTVLSGMAITTDSLQANIPKGDYMVSLTLTGSTQTSQAGSEDPHRHNLPSSHRGLKVGDRILVAWCGNEPVVIAIVVSS